VNNYILGGIIVQAAAFLLYVGYIFKNYGVLASLSESYYMLTKNKGALFTLFCWGIGFPLIVHENIFFLLSAIGLIFIGVAPNYKPIIDYTQKYVMCDSSRKTIIWWIHHVGAAIGITFAFIGLSVIYGQTLLFILFLILTLVFYVSKLKNLIWWIEILAFSLIIIGLIIGNLG
jgi:hypothetical protein